MEYRNEDNIDNTERNQLIPLIKKTYNNIEVIKHTDRQDNFVVNKNGYTLSHSSAQGQGEGIGNMVNINKKPTKKKSTISTDIQKSKISNNKIVDPSQIYLTPTQKIYKTLNDNMLFFNRYHSKKK